MAEDLATINRLLAAATSAVESEPGRAVDALNALAKEHITANTLVEKQIGKRLKPLRKAKDASVSAAAKAVQAAWMKVVMGEAENGKPAVVAKATDAKDAKDTDAGDATQAEGAAAKAADAAPADSGAAQEDKGTVAAKGGEELISTGDDKRDRLRTLLAGKLALADRVAGDEWTPHGAAAKIEEALHKLHGGDVKALSTKYRAIAVNIGDPKNPDFRRKILSGKIPAEAVPLLSSEDMASDARREENAKIREEALFQAERGKTTAASTNMFKCARCKKNQCTYFQMQTRSADEPMTTFVTCTNCNHRWKFC